VRAVWRNWKPAGFSARAADPEGSTKITDLGRICHIIPLLGSKRVTHVTKADVTAMMKDIMAGKTRSTERRRSCAASPSSGAA
jgi:hypothetical protein